MRRSLPVAAVAATAALLSPLALAGAAQARSATPAPSPARATIPGFTIGLVSLNGSGCRAGTAAVAPSPDGTAFTVSYSNYLAQSGAGTSPTDFRRNCQLTVQVNAPQGFTYAVAEADYRGYAYLAPGASAVEQANYYFQGMPQTVSASHPFSGPVDEDWQATDTANIASLVWSPCGEIRDLNINTQLRVSQGSADPGSTSFMTMDSTDGSLTTIYHLDWAQCPR
ncbi:DUF4360 domain-containing protein [Kitasatospora sp. LaBMicrA B282]|uniref:DUF4360 domain-containing protein n=1 Tax=Kitasatospora sp. LaBMicrA B282 TaxID=3420949 RepID=UPI003D0EB1A6